MILTSSSFFSAANTDLRTTLPYWKLLKTLKAFKLKPKVTTLKIKTVNFFNQEFLKKTKKQDSM